MGQYSVPCIIEEKDGKMIVKASLYSWNFRSGAKQMEHSYLNNPMVLAFEWLLSPEGPYYKSQVVWAGDYGATEEGYDVNLYHLCTDETHAEISDNAELGRYSVIVNHTKRIYIMKNEVDGDIHPLPLLVTETAGGGGGDYRGCNEHLLGQWARDVISMEKTAPEGYKKVSYKFAE